MRYRGVRIAAVLCVCAAIGGCMSTGFRKVWSGLDRADVLCDKRAYSQSFSAPPDEVYCRVYDELRKMGAGICKNDDRSRFIDTYGYNQIFPGCIDTTEVGVVVRPTSVAGVSDVVVASDNYILAGRVAVNLFSRLAGKDMVITAPDRPVEPVAGK